MTADDEFPAGALEYASVPVPIMTERLSAENGKPSEEMAEIMSRRIEIADYDPRWPDRYTDEKVHLIEIFRPILDTIHHVGSTSVPGLPAKPVIDILIVVTDDSNLGTYDQEMIDLGYTPRGECLDAGGTPGRYYYSKDTDGVRTHQVHICNRSHFQIPEILYFARYLREHPETASMYANVKTRAAAENRYDIAGYIRAKDPFIKNTITRALEEYTGILVKTIPCPTLFGKIRDVPVESMSFRPAVYALILHKGQILLLRNRHTGKYVFPGGGLHIGERVEEALLREVREETGLVVTVGPLMHVADFCFYYDPSDEAWHCLGLIYHCPCFQGELQTHAGSDAEEAEPPHWVSISALTPEDFHPHFRPVLDCIRALDSGTRDGP